MIISVNHHLRIANDANLLPIIRKDLTPLDVPVTIDIPSRNDSLRNNLLVATMNWAAIFLVPLLLQKCSRQPDAASCDPDVHRAETYLRR